MPLSADRLASDVPLELRYLVLEEIAKQFFDDWSILEEGFPAAVDVELYAEWFVGVVSRQVEDGIERGFASMLEKMERMRQQRDEAQTIAASAQDRAEAQRRRHEDEKEALLIQQNESRETIRTLRTDLRNLEQANTDRREKVEESELRYQAMRSIARKMLEMLQAFVGSEFPKPGVSDVSFIRDQFYQDANTKGDFWTEDKIGTFPITELVARSIIFARYVKKASSLGAEIQQKISEIEDRVGIIQDEDNIYRMGKLLDDISGRAINLKTMYTDYVPKDTDRWNEMSEYFTLINAVYNVQDMPTLIEAHRQALTAVTAFLRKAVVAMRGVGAVRNDGYMEILKWVEICETLAKDDVIIADPELQGKRCACCGQEVTGQDRNAGLSRIGRRLNL